MNIVETEEPLKVIAKACKCKERENIATMITIRRGM
jgi:hypothetical protein